MKTLFHLLLVFYFFFIPFYSDAQTEKWKGEVIEKTDIPKLKAEYRKIHFTSKSENFSFTVFCVTFAPDGYRASIIDMPNRDKQSYVQISDLAKRENAYVAINGGFFTEDFKPAGMCVINSKKLSSYSSQKLLSGTLHISEKGHVILNHRSDGIPSADFILQSGPFLVDPGGLMGIQTDQPKFHRRSLLALSTHGELLVLSTTRTSLYKLAECLVTQSALFGVNKIERALNLDGGPSTGMFVNMGESSYDNPEQWPVRNAILFYPASMEKN